MSIGVVDIGGTKIAVGLADKSGKLIAHSTWSTHPNKGPEAGLVQIREELEKLSSLHENPLVGIGIGCTGPIDPFTSELGVNAFLPGWEGARLCHPLEEHFHIPVFAENDADAAALGEYYWGAGIGSSRFLYLTVSTGIGGGFIINGQLYRGVNQSHPEVGHQILDPYGPACTCGARGCWEAFASGPAMGAWYANQVLAKGQSQVPLSAREICSQAEKGDPLAYQAVEREGFYLGIGIANLVSLFVPQVIALGGGVMQSSHLFIDRIQSLVKANCNLVPNQEVRIQPVRDQAYAGLVGAAAVYQFRSKD